MGRRWNEERGQCSMLGYDFGMRTISAFSALSCSWFCCCTFDMLCSQLGKEKPGFWAFAIQCAFVKYPTPSRLTAAALHKPHKSGCFQLVLSFVFLPCSHITQGRSELCSTDSEPGRCGGHRSGSVRCVFLFLSFFFSLSRLFAPVQNIVLLRRYSIRKAGRID